MLFSAAGAAGQIVVLVFAVGLPIQFALGALIALGRRIPGTVAAFVPALCLAAGLIGMTSGIDDAVASVGGSADPAWIPWFAVQDRARACAPAVLGAAAALLLVLPPMVGAAYTVIRTPPRRWWATGMAVGGGLVAALGMLVAGAFFGAIGDAVLPAVATLVLCTVAGVAVAEGTPPGRRAPPLAATRVGAAGFLVGAVAILAARVGLARVAALYALPEFDAPFSRVGALDAQALEAARAPWLVGPFLLVAALSLLPGIFLRRVRALPPAVGLDALAVGGLTLGIALVGGWGVLRWGSLGHLAGDHAVALLDDRGALDVPHLVPVPPRVLVLEPGAPRWITMRERGGVEIAAGVGPLEDVAKALQRGDGVVLPPDMTMEDVYFTLADVDANELVLVGCGQVAREAWESIGRDPLLAVGRCGGFPLSFLLTEELGSPRVLISLKDRYVDDGGDVVTVSELAPADGSEVLLRAQVDATVADLVATLGRLTRAKKVYFAWGVTLDGDIVPVGVNPGLSVSLRASPNGEVASPEAAPVPTPPAP